MMSRHRVASLLVVLLLPHLAVAQEDAGPDNPIPEGRFRVSSVETEAGPDAVTIEAVVQAPGRSGFLIHLHHANGSSLRSRGMFGSDPREKDEEIRLNVVFERTGDARFATRTHPKSTRTHPVFSLSTASSSGGGGGGGSIGLPPEQPLDEILLPTLEAGDYPIGEDVAAFRFGDDRYTIRVEPALPPSPQFVPIPLPMSHVLHPASSYIYPGLPIGRFTPSPEAELMRLIEQRVKDGTPIPPTEIPFGFDLEDEDEPGR